MKAKKSVEQKQNEKSVTFKIARFVKSNLLFVIVAIIVLILGLYLFFGQSNSSELQDKASFAKQLHIDENANLFSLMEILESNKVDANSTYNDDYYYSIKDDLEWLISSEDYLYHSKPSTDVYSKELAFGVFAETVIEINDSFSIEASGVDKNQVINQALNLEVTPIDYINGDEQIEAAFTPSERKMFTDTVAYLTNKYVLEKKDLINQTSSFERKYVEAKKIILLSEYKFDINS